MTHHIAIVESIYQAFFRDDMHGVIRHLHPQVDWEYWDELSAQQAGVPWLARHRGVAEVPLFFKALAEAQFYALEPRDFLCNEKMVAVTVFIDAAFPPSGRRIADEEMHLWTFDENDKVIAFRHYCDTAKHMYAADLQDAHY